MNMLFNTKKWSVLLIGMILSVFVSVLILGLADRIQRFAQNSSWIEASTQAYYKATSTIETQLMENADLRTQPWKLTNTGAGNPYSGSGYELIAQTGGSVIPSPWQGNSPFSSGYNLITLSEPVQLVIPNWVNWSNVKIKFRVPDLDEDDVSEIIQVSNTLSWVILWTFGSREDILYASGETNIIQYRHIFDGNDIANPFSIKDKEWFLSSNTASGETFWSFYTNTLWPGGDKCKNYKCTLKFSMIRRIPLDLQKTLPFLEYKIEFAPTTIPNRYMKIDSNAYVRGYLRSRHVEIPQITTNTALDFAVLQ